MVITMSVWNRHYILVKMFCLKASESFSDCQASEYAVLKNFPYEEAITDLWDG